MKDYDYHLIIPLPPKAQGRPRTRVIQPKSGRKAFATIYEDKADTNYKKTVAAFVKPEAPEEPLDCPLRVDIVFYFPRPQSHFGTGKNAGVLKSNAPTNYTSKPDRDNCDKAILDSLNGLFWQDDRLVCDGRLRKLYSIKPRTEIFIKILEKGNPCRGGVRPERSEVSNP